MDDLTMFLYQNTLCSVLLHCKAFTICRSEVTLNVSPNMSIRLDNPR